MRIYYNLYHINNYISNNNQTNLSQLLIN